jgi:hypothetical protein
MNKLKFHLVLVLMILLASCKEDVGSINKLSTLAVQDFVIQSVEKGQNEQIVCVGYSQSTNATLVHIYGSDLALLKSVNLSDKSEFKGNLKVKSLQKEGWLISSFKEGNQASLTVYKTDVDFNITDQREIGENHDTLYKATVRSIEIARNGDYLLTFDTIGHRVSQGQNFGGMHIVRLSRQLDLLFDFGSLEYKNAGVFSPRIVEAADENIHFAAPVTYADGMGIHSRITSGAISKTGDLLFDTLNAFEKRRSNIDAVGLSIIGSQILYNFTVNKDDPFYAILDTKTGAIQKEARMDNFNVNHQTFYGTYFNYFPAFAGLTKSGSANSLPKQIQPNQGQVMFSKSDGKIFMLNIDGELQITKTNVLILPETQEFLSYRQVYTSSNTAVVAVSYRYKGKQYLNLQEIDI